MRGCLWGRGHGKIAGMSDHALNRFRRQASRTDGRFVRGVFGLVFSAVAAVALSVLLANARAARAVRDGWVAAPCTIVASEVREGPNGSWLFSARYRYVFDGRERESSDVRPGTTELPFAEVARRARLLSEFPAGGAATCLVNPAAPSEAALLPPDAAGVNVALVFVGVFLVFGLAMQFAPSRRRRDESGDDASGRTEAPSRIPLFVGILFTAVGAVVAAFSASLVVRTIEARSWTPVEATVLRSEVVRGTAHTKHGTRATFRPYVAYAYEVGGSRFEDDRYGLGKVSTSDPGTAHRAVAKHPAGSRATVWVDPDDPSRSVLSDPRGPIPAAQYVFVAFPLVFLGIGLAALFCSLRDRRLAGAPPSPGPPVLRNDRRGQFARGIVFAALWNGFVALVFLLVRSSGGRADPVLLVFLGLFGLVGLALLVAALRAGARLFAPRMELTCGRGCLLRGGEGLVSYRLLGGGPGDVVGARIELVSQRFETVREGKNTYQRPVDLSRETVFETDSFRALARGDFRVAIPVSASASARGPEAVRWHFAVELARPARKPLRDEYPVVVR